MSYFLDNRLLYNEVRDNSEAVSNTVSAEEQNALTALENAKVLGDTFPNLDTIDMRKDVAQKSLITVFSGIFKDSLTVDPKNSVAKDSIVLKSSNGNKVTIGKGRIDLYTPIDNGPNSTKEFNRENSFGFPNYSIRDLKKALNANNLNEVKSIMQKNTTYADASMGEINESSIRIEKGEITFQRKGKSYTEALGFQEIEGTPCAFLSQIAG